MTIKLITNPKFKKDWNRVAPHPLQSWEWGEARIKMGIHVIRIGLFKNNTLIQVYQITFHKIPFSSFMIGYLPRSNMPSAQIIEFIKSLGKSNRAIFIKIEPYEEKNRKSQNAVNKLIVTKKIELSSHPLFPNWTQMIDLNQSEKDIFLKLKPKTRYNIKLAQKKGVVVTENTTDNGFKHFVKLYLQTCRRQKYHGHTRNYHKIVFDTLKNNISHILIASHDKKPLSAYELFIFNDVLYYPYGGSSEEHRNFMASNLIMWEAIRFGIKHKVRMFDLWGSLPPGNSSKTDSWSGFSRFKEGYSTNYVEFIGSFDIILNSQLYHIYNKANSIRKFLMRYF